MAEQHFDLEGGNLSLDFANTKDWHASDQPYERLREYADLVEWGKASNLLSAQRASHLSHLGKEKPHRASEVLSEAIDLREAIYRIFSRRYRETRIDPGDIEILNRALSKGLPHMRLASSVEGFTWEWEDQEHALDQMLWPVARAAADVLTSDLLERVRECEDDRGCGYLFIDKSRNKSRRWCSMESCGNRAKARRHYDRVRTFQLDES